MAETQLIQLELPNLVTFLAEKLGFHPLLARWLLAWENIIFSALIIFVLSLAGYLISRKSALIPGRLQNIAEIFVGGVDDFICGIMGERGRRFTPFIGTLFIYILTMNLFGLVPFMKSPTSSWSTTLGLALCVFVYVQYTAFRELGFVGYLDHMLGKPRGILAFSVFIPILMFFLHLVSEFVRPISLSLRLRSNIWGDDLLLAVLTQFGFKGIPLLLFNTFLTIIASTVQAVVFCLLSTIYFSLIIVAEEDHQQKEVSNGL